MLHYGLAEAIAGSRDCILKSIAHSSERKSTRQASGLPTLFAIWLVTPTKFAKRFADEPGKLAFLVESMKSI
jgi:hypothetical protein